MAKSKDGITATEAYQLVRDEPGFYSLESKLADGSWYATGLRTPIDPNRGLEHIAAYLWDVLEIDYADNDASGDGLRYVRLRLYKGAYEQRLTAAKDDGASSPRAPRRRPAGWGGRPTLKAKIAAAYQELLDDGNINFDAPKNFLYEPIRKKVQEYMNDPTLEKGLQDEALRKVIHPLFEADKSARSTSP